MSDGEQHFDGALSKPLKAVKSGQGKKLHDDGYDEDCVGDNRDLDYLNSLNELDREKVIGERYTKREEMLKKRDLLRYGSEKAATISKQQDMLERMKEERQKRRTVGAPLEADDEKLADYGGFPAGDSDSDLYDDEMAYKPGKKPLKKLKTRANNQTGGEEMLVEEDEEELNRQIKDTDKDLVHRICLTRQFLVSIASHIYFSETVKGCLVKITFKTSSDKMDYKIGEILDVLEKPQHYIVENKELNKFLIVKIGNETKEFKIQYISNKKIEDSELYRYLKELESYGQKIPTIRQVKNKHKQVVNILNSKYTARDIEQIVEKRNDHKMASRIYLIRKLRSEREEGNFG